MWCEAASTHVYVRGFIPSARNPDKIPAEIWTGRRQDVSHLRPFGCIAYVHVPKEAGKSKLDVRSTKCIMIGYHGRRAYRLWDPLAKKLLISRDVIFEEGVGNRTLPPVGEDDDEIFTEPSSLPGERIQESPAITRTPLDDPQPAHDRTTAVTPPPSPPSPPTTPPPIPSQKALEAPARPVPERRSTRVSKPSRRLIESQESESRNKAAEGNREDWAIDTETPPPTFTEDDHEVLMASFDYIPIAFLAEDQIPQSYIQAMYRPELWRRPMEIEMALLIEKGVWILVDPPEGANIMGGRWVFAHKYDGDGNIIKRKARWVGKGFSQIYGLDYDQTYGAVVRMESLRILLAIIAQLGLKMWMVDFVSAFLNSDIKHTVYMKQPDGFVKKGDEGKVCLLKKTLYGTMQGAHDWYETLNSAYNDLGYHQSKADPCIRSRREGSELTLTSTYTDDVLGASTTIEGARKAKAELSKRFKLTEVEKLHLLLGMRIHQESNGDIVLSQRPFFEKMLKDFGFTTVNPVATPLDPGMIKLDDSDSPSSDEDRHFMADKPYRPLLGSIMWGQACTRPDLSFAVNFLARFQNNPGVPHWRALTHVVRYIKGTLDYRIVYKAEHANAGTGGGLKPYGYCDADYGGCMQSRRSTSGYVFLQAGGATSWSAKRQASVSLSSMEAEYQALARAAQQAKWMDSFMSETKFPQPSPTIIRGDNLGSIALTENTKQHALAKHIDIRHHYIREQVQSGKIDVVPIPGNENVADLFTKPLTRELHLKYVDALGLRPLDS